MFADGSRHRQHVTQVGAAILIGRRSHGDEHDIAVCNRRRGIGGEIESAGAMVRQHHVLQARFVDRNHTVLESVDLVGIDIDAEHLIADFSQAAAGDQTDVAGAEYRYFHACWDRCGEARMIPRGPNMAHTADGRTNPLVIPATVSAASEQRSWPEGRAQSASNAGIQVQLPS